MLMSTGINRGSFSLLADAVAADRNYDWHVTGRCALGMARRMWGLEGDLKHYWPIQGEGALQALGLDVPQAVNLFLNERYGNKVTMLYLLRQIAEGGV